jgi:hypothetical protein
MRFAKCPDFLGSWGRITSPGSAQPQAWPFCAQEVIEQALPLSPNRILKLFQDLLSGSLA